MLIFLFVMLAVQLGCLYVAVSMLWRMRNERIAQGLADALSG